MKQNFLLDAGETLDKEILLSKQRKNNIWIKHYLVSKNEEKKYAKSQGDYFTFLFDDATLYKNEKDLEKVFFKTFKSFLTKYHKGGTILVIGLGNSSVLGDSFGPKILSQLIATNHYNDFLTIPKVALFVPETTSKTGISSFKLIEMVVHYLKPDVMILIDSFVTKNEAFLNRTLEINDCGVIFADQLRSNRIIDQTTFQIPVLSIGCPTLLKKHQTYFSKFNLGTDLDILTKIVANAINKIIMS